MLHLIQLVRLNRHAECDIRIRRQLFNDVVDIRRFSGENDARHADALQNAHHGECRGIIRGAPVLIDRNLCQNAQTALVCHRQHSGAQDVQILPHAQIDKIGFFVCRAADDVFESSDQTFRRPFCADVLLRIPAVRIDEHADGSAARVALDRRNAHRIRHDNRVGAAGVPVHRHHLCRMFYCYDNFPTT